jgi:hypothetical protein
MLVEFCSNLNSMNVAIPRYLGDTRSSSIYGLLASYLASCNTVQREGIHDSVHRLCSTAKPYLCAYLSISAPQQTKPAQQIAYKSVRLPQTVLKYSEVLRVGAPSPCKFRVPKTRELSQTESVMRCESEQRAKVPEENIVAMVHKHLFSDTPPPDVDSSPERAVSGGPGGQISNLPVHESSIALPRILTNRAPSEQTAATVACYKNPECLLKIGPRSTATKRHAQPRVRNSPTKSRACTALCSTDRGLSFILFNKS